MALSRGLPSSIWPSLNCPYRPIAPTYRLTTRGRARLTWRRLSSSFVEAVNRSQTKYQIYLSRCLDPYINLSIEHYLLQQTPIESTVLFLYTNKPCVVIGRNQNPWLEVNLHALRTARIAGQEDQGATEPVLLVRRRSGGGTVYHDRGNVNYSVICPTANFTRDKSAAMVAAALQKLGIHSANVNERHDIVFEPTLEGNDARAGANKNGQDVAKHSAGVGPLKISGSAYKLTRGRALHHGTCLLSSNLNRIRHILHSPARRYIIARGVESVRSPVGNVNVSSDAFQAAVIDQFGTLHGLRGLSMDRILEGPQIHSEHDWVAGVVDDKEAQIAEISKGVDELKVITPRQ